MLANIDIKYKIRRELEKLQKSKISFDQFVENIAFDHLNSLGIGQMKIKNYEILDRNTILNIIFDEDEIEEKHFLELGREGQHVSLYELLEAHKESQRENTSHFVQYCKHNEEVDVFYQIDILTAHDDDGATQVYLKDISKAISLQKNLSDEFYQEAIEANFSHQQMTPINNIINNARLIQKKISGIANRDLPSNEKFKKLQNFANWCLDITNQQLQSSQILCYYNRCQLLKMKIRQGNNSIEPRAIQRPEDEINKVLEPFRYQIEDLGIQVKIERKGANFAKYLTTDWEYYQLTMYNVIKNAVKHNVPRGSLHVQIEVVEESKSSVFLNTIVTDTGKGINPLTQKYIFKQFAEMLQRMKTGDQGIGAGLSSSKVIVEAIGGEIKLIQSRSGYTQFQIQIPIECHKDIVNRRRFVRRSVAQSNVASKMRRGSSLQFSELSGQYSSNSRQSLNSPNSALRFSVQSLSNVNSSELIENPQSNKRFQNSDSDIIDHLRSVIKNKQAIIDKLIEDDMDENIRIPRIHERESASKGVVLGQQNLNNEHQKLVGKHQEVENYLKQKMEKFSELNFEEQKQQSSIFCLDQSLNVSFEIEESLKPIQEPISFGINLQSQDQQSCQKSLLEFQNVQNNSEQYIPNASFKFSDEPRLIQPIIQPGQFQSNGLRQILEESKSEFSKKSPQEVSLGLELQRFNEVIQFEKRKEIVADLSQSQQILKLQALVSIKGEQRISEIIKQSDKIKCNCRPRILLVDDNKFNLLPLVTMLKTMIFDTDLIKRLKLKEHWSNDLSSYISQKEEVILEKMEICSLNEEENLILDPCSPEIPLCSTKEIITPDEVYDGFQAIIKYQESMRRPKCCQNAGYKLIVMDYNMPEINGLDATQQILQMQQEMTPDPDHEIKIVGLTANTGTKIQQECLEAGQKQIYEKPISNIRFKEMILLYHYRLTDSQYEKYIQLENK